MPRAPRPGEPAHNPFGDARPQRSFNLSMAGDSGNTLNSFHIRPDQRHHDRLDREQQHAGPSSLAAPNGKKKPIPIPNPTYMSDSEEEMAPRDLSTPDADEQKPKRSQTKKRVMSSYQPGRDTISESTRRPPPGIGAARTATFYQKQSGARDDISQYRDASRSEKSEAMRGKQPKEQATGPIDLTHDDDDEEVSGPNRAEPSDHARTNANLRVPFRRSSPSTDTAPHDDSSDPLDILSATDNDRRPRASKASLMRPRQDAVEQKAVDRSETRQRTAKELGMPAPKSFGRARVSETTEFDLELLEIGDVQKLILERHKPKLLFHFGPSGFTLQLQWQHSPHRNLSHVDKSTSHTISLEPAHLEKVQVSLEDRALVLWPQIRDRQHPFTKHFDYDIRSASPQVAITVHDADKNPDTRKRLGDSLKKAKDLASLNIEWLRPEAFRAAASQSSAPVLRAHRPSNEAGHITEKAKARSRDSDAAETRLSRMELEDGLPLPSEKAQERPRPKPRPSAKSAAVQSALASSDGSRLPQVSTDNGPMEVSIGSESNADSQAHEKTPAKPRELVKRLRYPQDRPGAVDVYNEDIAKLAEGEFLNDTIIELGLKVLHEEIRKRDSELADSIHIFSSFFYKRLTSTAPRDYSRAYGLVRKWAKVSIFTKKYLVLPINESLHWYLAIVVNPSYAVDEGRIAAMHERPSDPEREPVITRRSSKLRADDAAMPASELQDDEFDTRTCTLSTPPVDCDAGEDEAPDAAKRARLRSEPVVCSPPGTPADNLRQSAPPPETPRKKRRLDDSDRATPPRTPGHDALGIKLTSQSARYIPVNDVRSPGPSTVYNTPDGFVSPERIMNGAGDAHSPINPSSMIPFNAEAMVEFSQQNGSSHQRWANDDVDALVSPSERGTLLGGGSVEEQPSASPVEKHQSGPRKVSRGKYPIRPPTFSDEEDAPRYGRDSALLLDPRFVAHEERTQASASQSPEHRTTMSSQPPDLAFAPTSRASPVNDLGVSAKMSPANTYGSKARTSTATTFHDQKSRTSTAAATATRLAQRTDITERYKRFFQEGATVLVFDSLAGKHTKVTKDLTNYMKYTWLEQTGKWQEEAKRTVPLDDASFDQKLAVHHIDVSGPKQPNYCDCGLFVLHYFERFFSDPDKFCQDVIPSRQRDHEEWQKEEIELGRRQHWRDKIEELAQAWESKERETLEQKALANALKRDADKAAKESEDATRQAAEAMHEMEVDDAMQE